MATPAKIVNLELPIVVLIGRVNVGKSTLFNKIVEYNQAIVSNIPGTTRTRNVGIAVWRGKNFQIVDTGGLTFDETVPLEKDIIQQTETAVIEADAIVFVVDLQTGLLPQEKALAKKIAQKHKNKTIILVGNKADNNTWRLQIHDREWLRLGLGEPLPLSAKNGNGIGDLLDKIFKTLNKQPRRPKRIKEFSPIRVAIMGKPNVGKSSLFNHLIGQERVIVSAMPHTTREPHDTLVEYEGQHILFIDTAGIRRKAKVSGDLEKQGIGKSIEMITKSDIVLLLLDASEPITDQDKQLAGLLREQTRSVIIVINKWDTADDNDDAFRNEVRTKIYKEFPHLDFAPIVFTSSLTQYRIHQIFPMIIRAWNERQTQIPSDALQDFIKRATRKHLPSRGKGVRHPQIMGFTQLRANPPMFEMTIKNKTSVHFSYVHYLENKLREQFSFYAAPLIIKLSKLKRND